MDQLTGVCKNMVRGVVTLAFRCYAVGGETHPTSEARQVAWLTVDQARRGMVEARAVRISDALSSNGPFARTHDRTRLLDPLDVVSRVTMSGELTASEWGWYDVHQLAVEADPGALACQRRACQ